MLQAQAEAAAATGDIAAMLALIVEGTGLSEQDYIDLGIGSLRYLYYQYIDTFHLRPLDLEDLCDFVLYKDAEHYAFEKRKAMERGKKK